MKKQDAEAKSEQKAERKVVCTEIQSPDSSRKVREADDGLFENNRELVGECRRGRNLNFVNRLLGLRWRLERLFRARQLFSRTFANSRLSGEHHGFSGA